MTREHELLDLIEKKDDALNALYMERAAARQQRDDLAMLTRRLIYRSSKGLPIDKLLVEAANYLTRHELNGSPLRDDNGPKQTVREEGAGNE